MLNPMPRNYCPRCEGLKIYEIRRKGFRCAACKYDFTNTAATTLHARKKPVEWYETILKMRDDGLNAHQISLTGIGSYKAIWWFLKRQEKANAG